MDTIKTRLHHYRYNVEDDADRTAWEDLRRRLKAQGLRCFRSITGTGRAHDWYKELIIPLDGQPVELETRHLFDNQWNTGPTETSEQGFRVFDWAEAIYPNRHIKQGHYLEQTEEMEQARRARFKCGYCGAQYVNPAGKWCRKCLGSQYLKRDELRLLRLKPVTAGLGAQFTDEAPAELAGEYEVRQHDARHKRLEKDHADKLRRLERNIEDAKTALEAFHWLIDHGQDVENVIFYSHTGRFCFGWRTPIDAAEYSALVDVLCEFPFDYDVEKASEAVTA